MKAALKAPSAKIARKWFGSRKATKNASATGPAPRIAASMMSRKKPVRRESSVKPPTVRIRSIMLAFILPRGSSLRGEDLDALARQRPTHCNDDAVLNRRLEIGVHWQADDFPGKLVAHRQAAIRHRKIAIGGLAMQRFRVIDRRRDPLSFQCGRERIPAPWRESDGVLRPNRSRFVTDMRDGGNPGKTLGVTLRYQVSRHDFIREDFQFFQKDRCLDRIKPAGDADAHGVIFVGALAVHAQAFQSRGQ